MSALIRRYRLRLVLVLAVLRGHSIAYNLDFVGERVHFRRGVPAHVIGCHFRGDAS